MSEARITPLAQALGVAGLRSPALLHRAIWSPACTIAPLLRQPLLPEPKRHAAFVHPDLVNDLRGDSK